MPDHYPLLVPGGATPGKPMEVDAPWDGGVIATVDTAGDLKPRFVDYRGPGDHFGEMALIGDGRRTATIETVADSELFELDRSAFHDLLADVPRFAANLLTTLSTRLEHQTSRVEPKRRPRSVALLSTSVTTQGLLDPLAAALLDQKMSLQIFSDRLAPIAIRDDPRCTFKRMRGDNRSVGDVVASLRAGLASGLRSHQLSLVDLSEADVDDELPALLSQCEEVWWLVGTQQAGQQSQRLRQLVDRHPEILPRLRWVWILGEGERHPPPARLDTTFQAPSFKVFLAEDESTLSGRQRRSVYALVHHLLVHESGSLSVAARRAVSRILVRCVLSRVATSTST